MNASKKTVQPDDRPRVTIGMPAYNAEQYIESAIQCVLDQTYEDFELVISDNGSTDRTQAICEELAETDSRIRYVREEINRGVTWNYNRVVELAKGKYFRWMATDDVIAPSLLSKCVDVLDRFPELVLCYTKTGTIDADGNRVIHNGDKEERGLDPLGTTRLEDSWEEQRFDSRCAAIRYRGVLLHTIRCHELYGVLVTDKLRQTKLERPYVNGEKVLLAELALMGPFEQVSEYLFFSRWHSEQVSSIKPATGQAEAQDPLQKRTRLTPVIPKQLRCAVGYLGVIWQSRISMTQRIRCVGTWCRFLLQRQKMPQILRDAFQGNGSAVELQKDRIVVPLELDEREESLP